MEMEILLDTIFLESKIENDSFPWISYCTSEIKDAEDEVVSLVEFVSSLELEHMVWSLPEPDSSIDGEHQL